MKHAANVRSLVQAINIANPSLIWFKMIGESVRTLSQSWVYRRIGNLEPIILHHDNTHPDTSGSTPGAKFWSLSRFHVLLTPPILRLVIFIFSSSQERSQVVSTLGQWSESSCEVLDLRKVGRIFHDAVKKTCCIFWEICFL